MNTIVIYCQKKSARLNYVVNWIFKEKLQLPFIITTNKDEIAGKPHFIAYGATFPNAISIPAEGLLFEKGINQNRQLPQSGLFDNIPTIYSLENKAYTYNFDLFSAVFYLLTRYEEYLPFVQDKHNRYPATDSILHKINCLRRPIVDEWIHSLKFLLVDKFNISLPISKFSFLPTYDVDIPYAILYKGIFKHIAAIFISFLNRNIQGAKLRIQIIKGNKRDPFDSFKWIKSIHPSNKVHPKFFILCSLKNTKYDKNLLPTKSKMVELILELQEFAEIGLHPSYYSDKKDVMLNEKNVLETIVNKTIHISRQHYIKNKIPETYNRLITLGIKEDYSMGYGTHLGFRAGTGTSFFWYDLEHETETVLRVFPFCFMDTTAHYEEKLSVANAFMVLYEMTTLLQKTESTLITVFHNFSLGTDHEWEGWKAAYNRFLLHF